MVGGRNLNGRAVKRARLRRTELASEPAAMDGVAELNDSSDGVVRSSLSSRFGWDMRRFRLELPMLAMLLLFRVPPGPR